MQPTAETQRIESLDVLRGFALLGILLLNIVGFGMLSVAYLNPGMGVTGTGDVITWAGIELFAEGAMRCLFSILFGAGVLLFTTGDNAKGAGLHYKRNFWLLVLGLFDMFVLVWIGDILGTYALAGMLLYLFRNASANKLLVAAGVLILLMSLLYGIMNFGLVQGKAASLELAQMTQEEREAAPAALVEGGKGWDEFYQDFELSEEEQAEELAARQGSIAEVYKWNTEASLETLMFVVPIFLFWDALAMMLIGMALYKNGVLQGSKPTSYYVKLMLLGFGFGLLVNGYEVNRAIQADFHVLSVFPQMQVTYHFGRLGMALGWMGLIVLVMHKSMLLWLTQRLAAVGRMALTNYLMHSFICMILFTGIGFGLVGEFSRTQLYVVVAAIWFLQLWFSPWWLARYRFGPMEWVWRMLTYGQVPKNKRA